MSSAFNGRLCADCDLPLTDTMKDEHGRVWQNVFRKEGKLICGKCAEPYLKTNTGDVKK
jgi:uncharacterized protein with PIN domain